jgi:hypothetical protein
MSDANDTKVGSNLRRQKEQDSVEQMQELVRNLLHRVAMDGSKDFNALHYLQGIAANGSLVGLEPQLTAVVLAADADPHRLVKCLPDERIWVFDIVCSLNGVANLAFEDGNGNDILATIYAPNAGQGFVNNSLRGRPLPRGVSLFVHASAAINYSVDCSYAIVQDQAEDES